MVILNDKIMEFIEAISISFIFLFKKMTYKLNFLNLT